MTAAWQAGHTYPPGSLVKPLSNQPISTAAIPNNDFENGLTGWDVPAGWSLKTGYAYSGNQSVQLAPRAGQAPDVVSQSKVTVQVGQVINAQVMVKQGGGDSGSAGAVIKMVWYDASGAELSRNQGTDVHSGGGSHWKTSSGRFVAPSGAAQAAVAVGGWNNSGDTIYIDLVTWDYAYAGPPAGLVYKAVQSAPGKSGGTEPAWPTVLGQTVQDNEVTWEAVIATQLVWQAIPLLKSGDTEPAWPTNVDAVVRDGTINWIAVSRRITDPNCPQSKIVAIAANKVFAGDDDVVRFCATNNAEDWTALQDAGYLPTGLQAIGESNCSALALYRGNLAAFTPSSMQIWQVDPDPAKMVFLDAVDGVGTLVTRGHASVSGDLYFLSVLGVRSVSIAAGTANMAAGDIGTPIDTLVRDDLAAFTGVPLGIYLPSAGQYWLILGDHAWVFTYSPSAQIAAWSRYTFAFKITDACVLGAKLYIRDDQHRLMCMDTSAESLGRAVQDAGQNFDVMVRWPYADFGGAGGNLRSMGFDVLFSEGNAQTAGTTALSIGYDENAIGRMTDAAVVLPDERAEDGFIPLEVTAPSISVQVTYTGPNAWELTQVNAYLNASRRAP